MSKLSKETREKLMQVATSTLSGALFKRGFRNLFLQDVVPIAPGLPRMVGEAFTLRFIPAREDIATFKAYTGKETPHRRAMEECPPGHVLVIDSRGDHRAATAGDLYIGRLKARGCSGIVTDGGFRDREGILRTGLPAYQRHSSPPPATIIHQAVDLNLPIACAGVAVFPGDIIVGDEEGVIVIPPQVVDEVAAEALDNTLYDEFAEEEVARGRSLFGLFPAEAEGLRDFEAWRKKHGR